MGEGIIYLLTSFWLGAVHAATPGHGKTIAASYIVGVRGRPVDAVVLGADCAPMILPSLGAALDLETVLALCDGIMLTGSASNVHPSYYSEELLDPSLPQDRARDETTLPLIRAAVRPDPAALRDEDVDFRSLAPASA